MDPISPQFLRALTCAVWTLFVLIFAWLYARDREDRSRLWMTAWLAIEVHFILGFLGSCGFLPGQLSDWLSDATLLAAAAAFFLSVSPPLLIGKKQMAFWAFLFVPACAYSALLAVNFQPVSVCAGLILITAVSSGALAVGSASRRGLALVLWAALGLIPSIVTLSAGFRPWHGMDLMLFQAFCATGCAYWLRFRRFSPGVVLTSVSFLLWSLVWPVGDLLGVLNIKISDDSIIWDLPKYMVAVGMIITLLEEQAKSLQKEIAERRQAEIALRRSENWLRESQRVSSIGSYAVDLATGIWTGSEIALEILGIDRGNPEDFTVSAWENLIHPDFRAGIAAYFRQGGRPGEEPFDCECLILRKRDGQERWLQWRGALVPDESNRSTIAGTVQDVTDRKNIEQLLLESRKMESIGRLAGGVAHDFNNLLTVINGYSDILLRRLPANEPLRTKVSEIRDAGQRAADLTYQLLAFSRRQFLQPKIIDLNAVVSDTERLLARLIGENIRLSTKLPLALGRVEADPSQINQVLMNLAVNARDAMPHGGSLTIETRAVDSAVVAALPGAEAKTGEYICLSVTDTGTGMNEDTQQHLFEPFFTTKPRGQGTGLGLSTVYGIVRQSGGYLEVLTKLGFGSTFNIYLPSIDSPIAAPPPRRAASEDRFGTETILVVEDQSAVRKMICSILESCGYRTLQAGSGEDALGVLASHTGPIALVVSDVVMPGISGQALVEHLGQVRPDMSAILISGYSEDVLAHPVSGRVAFLSKPFSPDALSDKVAELLKRPVPALPAGSGGPGSWSEVPFLSS